MIIDEHKEQSASAEKARAYLASHLRDVEQRLVEAENNGSAGGKRQIAKLEQRVSTFTFTYFFNVKVMYTILQF